MGVSVSARGVRKTYTAGEDQVTVLDDLDLVLDEGETAAITGPSGSGKSTLLNILGSLDTADRGEVRVGDLNLSSCAESRLSAFRSTTVGFVFQAHHLLPQCTVSENVRIPTLVLPKEERKAAGERSDYLIEQVGMSGKENRFPSQLSGGERLRVAVARALINQPGIILADEPTGSLDHDTALRVMDLLRHLSSTFGTTLLVVTHSTDVAATLGTTYKLSKGRLIS